MVPKYMSIPDSSYSFKFLEIKQSYYSCFTRKVLTDREVKGLTTVDINRSWMNEQLNPVFYRIPVFNREK